MDRRPLHPDAVFARLALANSTTTIGSAVMPSPYHPHDMATDSDAHHHADAAAHRDHADHHHADAAAHRDHADHHPYDDHAAHRDHADPTDHHDHPYHDATGPPRLDPYVSDLVKNAFADYKRHLKSLQAKTKAHERLTTTVPKSLASKTEVQMSKALEAADPEACAALKTQWTALKATTEATQHEMILAVCSAELDVLKMQLHSVGPALEVAIDEYLALVNMKLTTYGSQEVVPPMTVPRGGGSRTPQSGEVKKIALFSLSNMIAKFIDTQARLDAVKQLKTQAAQAARFAADSMEIDTPNDILVGALVKREIAKNTAALRKEVNQLRAALNSRAGRKTKGATGPPPPKKPAGGRAKEPKQDAKTKPRAKPNANARANKPDAESKPTKKNPQKSTKSNSPTQRKSK
jgi:hypothetical protein